MILINPYMYALINLIYVYTYIYIYMYIYIYILESARAISRALDSSGYPKVLDYNDLSSEKIVADGGGVCSSVAGRSTGMFAH